MDMTATASPKGAAGARYLEPAELNALVQAERYRAALYHAFRFVVDPETEPELAAKVQAEALSKDEVSELIARVELCLEQDVMEPDQRRVTTLMLRQSCRAIRAISSLNVLETRRSATVAENMVAQNHAAHDARANLILRKRDADPHENVRRHHFDVVAGVTPIRAGDVLFLVSPDPSVAS